MSALVADDLSQRIACAQTRYDLRLLAREMRRLHRIGSLSSEEFNGLASQEALRRLSLGDPDPSVASEAAIRSHASGSARLRDLSGTEIVNRCPRCSEQLVFEVDTDSAGATHPYLECPGADCTYAERILHGGRGFVGEFRQQSRKQWRAGTGAGLE